MALLMLFGFVAGAGTALSPCVLPVLPIALSAGATGGRRRPLGIVVGLAVSFTFATVALVYVISALGLPNDLLRKLAIAVLLAFGITLMIPPLAARVEAWLSRFASRAGVAGGGGDGFWSGTAVGASLGLVYAPCAGPILAGVITVSASQPFTRRASRGCAQLRDRLRRRPLLPDAGRQAPGCAARPPRRRLADRDGGGDGRRRPGDAGQLRRQVPEQRSPAPCPASWSTRPKAWRTRHRRRPRSTMSAANRRTASAQGASVRVLRSQRSPRREREAKTNLPVLGTAPEFVDNQRWFNTPGDEPLTLSSLRGRVVLVDFWTYSCINCLRTLPYLTAWDKKYRKDGLTIVGVHSPEFPFEKEASNVEEAIERNGIQYPVAQDNELATWNAYGNQYWPAEYFIDAKGRVRYAHFGEGEYGKKEQIIRQLLAEAGRKVRRQGRPECTRSLPRRPSPRPRPTSAPPGPNASPTRCSRPAPTISAPRHLCPPTNSLTTGDGESHSTRRRLKAARSTSTSAPGGPTWCLVLQGSRARCGSCSTAGRSRAADAAPTSTTAWSRSPPSASTTWSTCPGSKTTC